MQGDANSRRYTGVNDQEFGHTGFDNALNYPSLMEISQTMPPAPQPTWQREMPLMPDHTPMQVQEGHNIIDPELLDMQEGGISLKHTSINEQQANVTGFYDAPNYNSTNPEPAMQEDANSSALPTTDFPLFRNAGSFEALDNAFNY